MEVFAEFIQEWSGRPVFIKPESVDWVTEKEGRVVICAAGTEFRVEEPLEDVCEILERVIRENSDRD
jgi:2-hydroxy-3-keto-5-methylthiopentenyl-1-phosphate phosphatase